MSARDLEQATRLSTMALRDIAAARDCDYVDVRDEDRPLPCPCPKCTAQATLDLIEKGPRNWRYKGAFADRIDTMPRERRIIESWRKQVDDHLLGQILTERSTDGLHLATIEEPSVRDWYVATSVVQWLATNVGMEVLRQAGFEYKEWDADRTEREKRRGGGK